MKEKQHTTKTWTTTSPAVSQLTPASSSRKTVLTFEQLQASLPRSEKKRMWKKSVACENSSSSYSTPSPVAIRIRQEILHTEPTKPQTGQGRLVVGGPLSENRRRDRLFRKQQLVRGIPESLSTPKWTTSSSLVSTSRFFTPSPIGPIAPNADSTTSQKPSKSAVNPSVVPLASPLKPVALESPSGPGEKLIGGKKGSIFSPAPVASKTQKRQPRLTVQTLPVPLAKGKSRSPVPPTNRRENKRSSVLVSPLPSGGTSAPQTSARTPLRPVNTQTPSAPEPSPGADDGPSTRRNLDKRSARLQHSGQFSAEIAKHEEALASSPRSSLTYDSSVSVFVRKRPIFEHEMERSDFDVVRADGPDVRVYKTQMGADMKKQTVQPFVFHFTSSFDEDTDSSVVYQESLQPLVELVQEGRPATLLMFGQTGSGKTFTMTACQELVAHDILSTNSATVQCVELKGNECQDLLTDPSVSAKSIRLMDNARSSSVSFVNATTVDVTCPHKLIQVLEQAQGRRATQSTAQNQVSSRSHAIYQIRLDSGGVLTLVDCAGTERKNDSLYHSRQRQAESVDINASLYALKECIRAKRSTSKNAYVPYRSNTLTRVLRESLERLDARLVVIATVAPNATDTEHSLETLKTVSNLTHATWEEGEVSVVQPPSPTPLPVPPKKWTHDELVGFLKLKRLYPQAVPEHLDGRAVMRMSKLQLRNALYDDDSDMADRLFRNLRAETDRIARLDLKRRMASSRVARQ